MYGDNDCGQRDLYEQFKEADRLKKLVRQLLTVRVLWRAPDTLDLWGIPYEMREGQTPYDLFRSPVAKRSDWVWLGQPGYWGHYDKSAQHVIKAFLEKHVDLVPQNPTEFSSLPNGARYEVIS